MSISNSFRDELKNMSMDDLKLVSELIVQYRDALNAIAATRFQMGQKVEWVDDRPRSRGRTIVGVITRFKRAGIVQMGGCTDGCIWTVSASKLRKIM